MRRLLTLLITSATALAVLVGGTTAATARPLSEWDIGPRVVNGEPGPSEDFGFLVALGDRARFQSLGMDRAQFCGGTLASQSLVITAAHCVNDLTARNLVVGSFPDGDLASEGGTVVNVSAIKVHPRYQRDNRANDLANDIAVLTLARPLRGVPTLTPATPDEATVLAAPRAPASVAGWGAINHSEPWKTASVYRIGSLVVFPTSACGEGGTFTIDGVTFRGYGPGSLDPRVMLCAEGVRAGTPVDSCVGDSGGPLAAGTGESRRLIGIVSWGLEQCATRLGPGVYTRVSAFTTFLASAGVPFAPEPTDTPLPPRITRVATTATAVTITVTPASGGLAPDQYAVAARDPSGQVTSCTVDAPPRPQTARCTIADLTPGTPYVVTAIAIAAEMPSGPSAERVVTPAGLPATPRIIDVRTDRGGFAGFVVSDISGNGSPVIRKAVRCAAKAKPPRSAPIVSRGIALISGLSRGTTYSCVAVVANEFGVSKSDKVRVRAR